MEPPPYIHTYVHTSYLPIQVPIITYNSDTVFDSTVINEYLNETFPDNKLMPESPVLRAKARNAIDYFTNYKLAPLFYRMLAHQEFYDRIRDMLLVVLKEMDKKLRENSGAGPYWFGEQFTLVDLALFPFIDRFVR